MFLSPVLATLLLVSSASAFDLRLEPIGTYATGVFDEGASEIVAHDPRTQRLFVVNANEARVDVLDIRDPSTPSFVNAIEVGDLGGGVNSVAVAEGLVAVAVEAHVVQRDGVAAFYDAESLRRLAVMPVGALPDNLVFTPDGRRVLVANEGEPDDDYRVDPEGSISVIDLSRGVHRARVATADFRRFDAARDELVAAGVRIYGPGASVARDLEPEYITVSKDSRTAWATLQENNAIAVLDVESARVTQILPLGFKDHARPGHELDASNRDGAIHIRNWPVHGMFQPDAIASFSVWGKTFLVTANEGDTRDYPGFSEEARVGNLALDPTAFPDASLLQGDENLGRLEVTTTLGSEDGVTFQKLFSFGTRSLSVWTGDGRHVFDSGSELERITARAAPGHFNAGNDDNAFDGRSDNRGPEPEGVAIGRILGRSFAFLGLERIGGVVVYEVTNPWRPRFVTYHNNRNFEAAPCLARDDDGQCETGTGRANPAAGDLGPEGLLFIPWWESPIRRPLLVVGNEVSGTTTIFRVWIVPRRGPHPAAGIR